MESNLMKQKISFLENKEQEINVKKDENISLDLTNISDASLTLFLQKNSVCNLRIFFKNQKNCLI